MTCHLKSVFTKFLVGETVATLVVPWDVDTLLPCVGAPRSRNTSLGIAVQKRGVSEKVIVK